MSFQLSSVEELAVVQPGSCKLLLPVLLQAEIQNLRAGHAIRPDHPAGHRKHSLVCALQARKAAEPVSVWIARERQIATSNDHVFVRGAGCPGKREILPSLQQVQR